MTKGDLAALLDDIPDDEEILIYVDVTNTTYHILDQGTKDQKHVIYTGEEV